MSFWRKLNSTPWLFVSLALPCQSGDLGQCVADIYRWSLTLVGIAAFVQIIIAGFSYITAAGNVGQASSAKSKISGALLGVVILFSSYIILNTINPDLVGGSFSLPGDKSAKEVVLLKLSPESVPAGGTLILTGTNFTNRSQVLINGQPQTATRFINGLELRVPLGEFFKEGDELTVSVRDNEQETTSLTIKVIAAGSTTLDKLDPSSGNIGDLVSIIGQNLKEGTAVFWNDGPVTSNFVDEETINFRVPDSPPGEHQVELRLDSRSIGKLKFTIGTVINRAPDSLPSSSTSPSPSNPPEQCVERPVLVELDGLCFWGLDGFENHVPDCSGETSRWVGENAPDCPCADGNTPPFDNICYYKIEVECLVCVKE